MCKYFRNKDVHIWYEYSDSFRTETKREVYTKYDSFIIEGDWAYNVRFLKKNKIVYEHIFEPDWEFQGLGQLHLYGFGAGSHFSITIYK